jgi:environmental stress-induced protein Ves
MRIIRTSEYRRMPWKNGGGETTEIIASPDGAPLDAFDWRISMAKVASAGPFSVFPAIDRTLTIIDGRGLNLVFEGRGSVRLDRDSTPFAFPADVTVAADLVDGAIEDLNVMTRRGWFRHHVARLSTAEPVALPRHGDIMLVLVRGASATVRSADADAVMGDGDTLLLTERDASSVEIVPAAALELYVVDIWPA